MQFCAPMRLGHAEKVIFKFCQAFQGRNYQGETSKKKSFDYKIENLLDNDNNSNN